MLMLNLIESHCVKYVRIRSFSGLYFPEFGLNTARHEDLSVFSLNAGKYGPEKLRIRTLFHAMSGFLKCFFLLTLRLSLYHLFFDVILVN